jgi:hypothetical protein
MRYRAEEDGTSGELVPPKPHRLKPLGDEDFERSGDGATKSEDASITPSPPSAPRPPGRPLSADQMQSPKTRTVKASASGSGADGLAETGDSMSGASTADTMAPLDDMTSSPSTDGKKHARVAAESSPPLPSGSAPPGSLQPPDAGTDRSMLRANSETGTSYTKAAGSGSAKLQMRRSMVMPPAVITTGSAREMVNFLYRKAEQRFLWHQMQHRTEDVTAAAENHTFVANNSLPKDKTAEETDERGCSKLDVLGLLDLEEPTTSSTSLAPVSEKKDKPTVRRQSVYILKAEDDKEDIPAMAQKGAMQEPDASDSASPAATGSTAPAAPVGPHPLKELLTAKKVDLKALRAACEALPNISQWFNTVLDPGPPYVPKPIAFAVASGDPAIVDLIIEFGADVCQHYDGPSMYKGWLRPGQGFIASVVSRKGRFLGTMLADRLTQIEMSLRAAEGAQQASNDDEEEQEDADDPEQELLLVDEVVEDTKAEGGATIRRKSVAVKTLGGSTMRHTQGHPGLVFEISEHLGDGDRSSVWLAFHKETKSPVAIKTEQKSPSIEAWLWEEINVMRKVEHPNIGQLFETFESDEQLFMVLELCEGGRLFEKCTPDGCAAILQSPKLMRQTALAVNFLHCKGIAHRDIQLDNFLLADDKPLSEAKVKLIDFTTAKFFGADHAPLKTKICTPSYVAKEILTRKEVPYTEKVDIWSLGVCFFIMLSGSPPFSGSDDMETLKKVKKGSFKFEPEDRWAPVPDEAKQLIASMIKPTVEERLSAQEVLGHAFLANVV